MNQLELQHKTLSSELISENLSDRYAPVNTELLLKPFIDKGWHPIKTVTNKNGTKDWVTLEHNDFKFLNGDTVRIEVRNSYDGTSSLMLMGGIGRIVCSNGMVVGKDFESFRFRHSGTKIYEKLDNAYEKLVAKLEELKLKVDKLNNLYLPPSTLDKIARNIAVKLIESDGVKEKKELLTITSATIQSLYEPHRDEDKKDDAWVRLNVLQENIVRLGRLKALVRTTTKENGAIEIKEYNKRGNEGKLSSFELNKIITDEFLKEVA